jgi:hypothetical protein
VFMTVSCSRMMSVTPSVTRQLCSMKPSNTGQGGRASGLTFSKAAARHESAGGNGVTRGSRAAGQCSSAAGQHSTTVQQDSKAAGQQDSRVA